MTLARRHFLKILDGVDIVEVIKGYLPKLRPRKRNDDTEWITLCPFHSERKASFSVTRKKQLYHCFGCGANGNAVSFISEYAGIFRLDAYL